MPVAQRGTVEFYNKKLSFKLISQQNEIIQMVSKIKDEFDAEPTTILGLMNTLESNHLKRCIVLQIPIKMTSTNTRQRNPWKDA